jgi:hypothetical protein
VVGHQFLVDDLRAEFGGLGLADVRQCQLADLGLQAHLTGKRLHGLQPFRRLGQQAPAEVSAAS